MKKILLNISSTETMKNAANLITPDHHVIKGSGVTFDKLTSTEIYSILVLKIQISLPLIFFSKICLMTMILTG